jgi:hypothetical protein
MESYELNRILSKEADMELVSIYDVKKYIAERLFSEMKSYDSLLSKQTALMISDEILQHLSNERMLSMRLTGHMLPDLVMEVYSELQDYNNYLKNTTKENLTI